MRERAVERTVRARRRKTIALLSCLTVVMAVLAACAVLQLQSRREAGVAELVPELLPPLSSASDWEVMNTRSSVAYVDEGLQVSWRHRGADPDSAWRLFYAVHKHTTVVGAIWEYHLGYRPVGHEVDDVWSAPAFSGLHADAHMVYCTMPREVTPPGTCGQWAYWGRHGQYVVELGLWSVGLPEATFEDIVRAFDGDLDARLR